MARFVSSLSTLQARTILSAIVAFIGSLSCRSDIENAATSIVDNLISSFPVQFPSVDRLSFLSFALSSCAKEGIKRGELAILDYMSMLADIKENNESELKDFGAFGDLFEILVRCAFMRKLSLVRWSVLSVKAINTADIASKKYGVIEVGHNGKTFTFGTMFDYMEGNYTSVVYGVFSEEDKKAVYSLVRNKDYEKAIDYVANYCGYWADKYDFQKDMDSLTRGKGITAKGANIQVVYNEGKYNAFVAALEDGTIKSLAETLSE
jgi:hypothetical protein